MPQLETNVYAVQLKNSVRTVVLKISVIAHVSWVHATLQVAQMFFFSEHLYDGGWIGM